MAAGSLLAGKFPVAKAEAGVVVDEADGLHERIDSHRTEELEAKLLQFGGYSVGEFRLRGHDPIVGLGVLGIVQRLAVRERPEPL